RPGRAVLRQLAVCQDHAPLNSKVRCSHRLEACGLLACFSDVSTRLSTGFCLCTSKALRGGFSVEGMDVFQAFVLLTSNGVGFLCAIAERSAYDVASGGIALSTAKNYATLADVLFGPADFLRIQRDRIALGEQRGLSV